MSRVGSKEINIPESVKINLQDGLISAEGPLGKLESKLNSQIEVIVEGQKITMKPKSDDKTLVSFWGLQRNLVNNLIIGVSEGFTKKLEMNGVELDAPLYLSSKNPKKEFQRLFKSYKKIEAAGGIVQRKKSYLVIKRKGLWDIPKGRIDNGESAEHACVREIMEECGIDGHEITMPLTTTYHTMKWNGKKALKKTFWYMLTYDGTKKTKPETKEDITEAVWMKRDEMLYIRGNTFGSINDVLDAFESIKIELF